MAKPNKNKTPSRAEYKKSGQPLSVFPWSVRQVQLFLITLCLICYTNTLGHGFVLDDDIVFRKNIYTQAGLQGIGDIVSHDSFQGYFKGEQKNLVAGGRYRPLSLVLFAIEKTLAGETPWFFHSIHLLLFILTVIMVFRFTTVALSKLYDPETLKWIAAWTAVFFAVHPIHTEVAANIKSSDEILSFLFGMTAVLLLWEPSPGTRSKTAALFIYTLALFSKENALLWLPLGWLTYYFLGQYSWWDAVKKISPLLLPVVFFICVRFFVLHQGDLPQPTLEWLNNPFLKIIQDKYTYCTPGEKWGSIIYSLVYYLRLHIWPYPLTHDYYPNHFPLRSMADPAVIASVLTLMTLVVLAWMYRIKKPVISFCILFFFGALILVSNIFFPVGILFSERFAFTASYAYVLLMACWLAPYFKLSNKPVVFIVAAAIVLGILATINRNQAWKDNYTLFKTDIEHSPSSAKINNALAGELLARSEQSKDSLEKKNNYMQADRYLKKAVSIHPLYIEAWLLQGNSWFYQGRYDESITAYTRSLEIAPGYENSLTNLHLAYREGGKYWGEKVHNLEKALGYLLQAYQLKSNDFETLRLLGVAYGVAGNNVKAIEFLEKARAIKPENASVLYNLGSAYLNSGNPNKGQEFLRSGEGIRQHVVH